MKSGLKKIFILIFRTFQKKNVFNILILFCFWILISSYTNKKVNKQENFLINDTVLILEKRVTLTVYHPIENQCDNTPLITANGTKIDLEKLKKDKIKYCAVSRDLLEEIPYNSVLYIENYGEYKVVDTMNKRIKNTVDILQDINKPIFKKENVKILRIK